MKKTKNLSETIILLLGKHHALTAKQLGKLLTNKHHAYNKTSVYRALEKLVLTGQVCKYHFSDEEVSYELRDEQHLHLVCQECASVTTAAQTSSTPTNLHGFLVDHSHTTLYGQCADCQNKHSVTIY